MHSGAQVIGEQVGSSTDFNALYTELGERTPRTRHRHITPNYTEESHRRTAQKNCTAIMQKNVQTNGERTMCFISRSSQRETSSLCDRTRVHTAQGFTLRAPNAVGPLAKTTSESHTHTAFTGTTLCTPPTFLCYKAVLNVPLRSTAGNHCPP